MGWTVWGEMLETADLTSPNKFQPVKFHKPFILLAVRTWVIVYNDPAFTNLNMKVYSNNAQNNMPKKLLHTSSNVRTKPQVHTLPNGIKEIFFEFDKPVFTAEDTFNFVLQGTGYTFSESSHLSWKKAFPDPVYTENVDLSSGGMSRGPYAITFIGSRL